jgi:3-deoxy-7-phosphoheptulonate synthase
MKSEATKEEITSVVKEIKKFGLKADVSRGEYRTVIGLIGDERRADFSHFATLPGVKEAFMVETPYKLISRDYGRRFNGGGEPRLIRVGDVTIGGDELAIIAGPCTVESKSQLFRIAEEIKKAGAQILRGGIFKPRSSVHSFQGLGANGREGAEEALRWLYEAGQRFEMPVVTEVRGETQIDLVASYADIIQVGARNMYNQDLLASVAGAGKPVLFKRHFGAGIDEFLSFAEYMAAEGNKDIILCERGILPLGKGKNYTRYTFDLSAIPAIQKETYLPVVADPSHATGRRDLIFNMSCAAVAAGASGLMIEAHYDPSEAMVDGMQMITPDELKEVISACRKIHKMVAAKNEAKVVNG